VTAVQRFGRFGILVTSALAAAALAATAPVPPPVSQAAQTYITRGALEATIRFLSSDLLEGRGPATRGDQLARLYLQTRLEGIGYQPAFANGAWQQPFDIVGIKGQFPKSWSFQGKGGHVDLAWRDDYIAVSGLQQDQVSVNDAELVFVGYGIQAPEFQWDDFKGMDLHGKVLVMMNNDPDWDPKLFAGKRRLYYGRWVYKYESAARQGAAGAIIIHTTPSAGYPWQVVQSSMGGEQFDLPAGREPRLQVKAWATEAALKRLLQAGGFDLDKLIESARSRDFKPVPLAIRTTLAFTNQISRVQTANVGGILPGSDPQLAKQLVCCRRTTITSASVSRMRAATASIMAPSTMLPAARRCWQSRARSRRYRSTPAAPSSRCSSPVRSAGCSARSSTPSTRQSPPVTSLPISTSTAATSSAAPATSPW